MKTYAQVERMLELITDQVPQELYRDLSGGVILSESVKLHPNSIPQRPLYIMGEYQNQITGRLIVIYFGSFNVVYGALPDDDFFEKLRHVFAHELRHHVEMLSGVKDLERFDDERFGRYIAGVDITEFHEPPIA